MSANVSVEDGVINGGNVDVKLMPKSTRENLKNASDALHDAWGRSSPQQGGYSIGDHAASGLFPEDVTADDRLLASQITAFLQHTGFNVVTGAHITALKRATRAMHDAIAAK